MVIMNKKAFTLLEIIVSTIILALVIGGLANVFVVAKRRIVYSRSKMQTAELGRLFLDPLQSQVRQDEWGANCLTGRDCSAESQTQTLDNIPYTPTYETSALLVDAQNPQGRLRKVKVTISWDEPVD